MNIENYKKINKTIMSEKMNLKNKLCTCLTEDSINNCIEEIPKIKTNLIEHRIDFLENISNLKNNLNLEEIYSFGKKSKKEFIATCRNINCGGKFSGTDDERINILINAIESGANIVDIEIETKKELIDKVIKKARQKNCLVIISMHNFEFTPPFKEILGMMIKQRSYGANIGKVVCKANTINDCHNLLDLILEANKIEFPIISFGMGEVGKFSRISSLLYGAPFTFIAHNNNSAPGQLTYEQINNIFDNLGVNKKNEN